MNDSSCCAEENLFKAYVEKDFISCEFVDVIGSSYTVRTDVSCFIILIDGLALDGISVQLHASKLSVNANESQLDLKVVLIAVGLLFLETTHRSLRRFTSLSVTTNPFAIHGFCLQCNLIPLLLLYSLWHCLSQWHHIALFF